MIPLQRKGWFARARAVSMRRMPMPRRQFVAATVAALLAGAVRARAARNTRRLRAVAFDGFAIFDARRVLAVADSAFPGRGAELVNARRARQFDYQWLRVSGVRYVDFERVTADSLDFAARSLGVELSADPRAALLDVYRELDAWPDAEPALRDRVWLDRSFI